MASILWRRLWLRRTGRTLLEMNMSSEVSTQSTTLRIEMARHAHQGQDREMDMWL